MTDQHGTTLTPGDPVLYEHDPKTTATATVLLELDDNRYLIQLDPGAPTESAVMVALRDQLDAVYRDADLLPIDAQEAFEVDGATLTFMGDWDDGLESDEPDDE